jgi:phospholipase/carboxylesterase
MVKSRPGSPILVALHGRGATSEDLVGLGELVAPGFSHVCPDAPWRWPARGAPVGRCWYESGPERRCQIAESRETLARCLTAARAELGGGPVVLLGFSQGALMTMDTGLRDPSPAAALVALSGYLEEEVGSRFSPPLLMMHGATDDVVPISKGRESARRLSARGVRVTYEEFDGAHEIASVVVRRVARFLVEAVGPS